MLDIMRKHTRSWLIKLVFTLIVLSFIFFFGYSSMQKSNRSEGGKNAAAIVNGEAIPYGAYKLAYENTQGYFTKMFPDGIPEGMSSQIKNAALAQLIGETLFSQFAGKIGISVTDLELYDFVSHDPNFQQDGVFSASAYKGSFLPYFERKYGLNYEDYVKKALLAAKVKSFLTGSVSVSEQEAREQYEKENTDWNFERIKVPESPAKDANYDISAEEIAKKVLATAKAGNAGELQQLIKKYKLLKEDIKEVSIDKRDRLIPETGNEDIYSQLFSLTMNAPTTGAPIRSGPAWYIFKLTGYKTPSPETWEKEKTAYTATLIERMKQDYLLKWQDQMKDRSKIDEYVLSAGK